MNGLRAFVLLIPALLAACASPGGLVVPPGHDYAGRPPPRANPDGILLLYAHGSRQEFARDRCFPHSFTTPRWLRRLAGLRVADLPVSVYAVCTPSRTGEYDHGERRGESKVVKRTRELETAIDRFVARGFAPERVFLAGHSAGGWAALLAAHDGRPPVGGVIAFAPAFAGPARTRSAGWQWLRDVQAGWLADSEHLPALVFAYRGDTFEAPGDLDFLQKIPGLQFIAIDPAQCGRIKAHRAVFSACVMDTTQQQRIVDFIQRRLAETRGPRRGTIGDIPSTFRHRTSWPGD